MLLDFDRKWGNSETKCEENFETAKSGGRLRLNLLNSIKPRPHQFEIRD